MTMRMAREISGGSPEDDEEKTAEQIEAERVAAAEAEAAKGTPLTMENLNEYLAQRDQALVQTVQQGMVQMLQEMHKAAPNAQGPTEEEVRAEAARAQRELNITPEEFWKNPQAAMEKFYEVKTAPLKTDVGKRSGPDHGLTALAETRVQGLWNKLSDDEKKKYGPFLTQVVKETDVRVLADTKGIDSVWRLTKSHADEFLDRQEAARTTRNQKANMVDGDGIKHQPETKVTLTAEQAGVAEAFGLSPELYAKHSVVTEVEPGGNRKKK